MKNAIVPAQSRAGRALLNWSRDKLATSSEVSARTLASFELGNTSPKRRTVDAIRTTLEAAGVEFTNGDAPGVKLRSGRPTVLEPRWLDREEAAKYICVRVDDMARLERSGRLPQASYHLGPRTPRWDRLALDAVFSGAPASVASTDTSTAVAALVGKIHKTGGKLRGPKTAG